jgi:hypothetical protein
VNPVQLPLELPPDGGGRELRWRRRESVLRLRRSGFTPADYAVAPFEKAKGAGPLAFARAHHYSGEVASPRLSYGLWRRRDGALVGVATLDVGMNHRTLTNVFPELVGLSRSDLFRRALELGRFVLLDEVPGRAETWFLARVFEHAEAQGLRGVVSFSDPVPRRGADGRVVFRGHARAQQLFPLGPCARCGRPGRERHHRDGDTLNNTPGNVVVLCRRCHLMVEGRLAAFVDAGAPYRTATRPPKPCATCGRPAKPLRRGECKACADYRRRVGAPRPERLWRKTG